MHIIKSGIITKLAKKYAIVNGFDVIIIKILFLVTKKHTKYKIIQNTFSDIVTP